MPERFSDEAKIIIRTCVSGANTMMNAYTTIRDRLNRIEFPSRAVPLAYLTVCVFGFGLLLNDLGFYMDDWSYVFYAKVMGIESLYEMLLYDSRPYAAWLYIIGFQLLGFKPLYWQIAILLLRWGTASLMWLTLRAIWPHRLSEVTAAGLLFAIYPFFLFQPAALGSSHHWIGFFLFIFSIYLMVIATNDGKRHLLFTAVAIASEAVHLFTSEYFSGLELIRPLILWILFTRVRGEKRQPVLLKIISSWLPYLIVLAAFAIWRLTIFENPPGVIRNEPVVLAQFINEPAAAFGFLLNAAIKDPVSVMTLGWQRATEAELVDFSSPFGIFRILASLVIFTLTIFFLNRLVSSSEPEHSNDDWVRRGSILAFAALLLAGLPIWLVGRTLQESKNLESASRVGIPATLGAALLISLIIFSLIEQRNKRTIVISLLVALAVNFQLANSRGFRFSWEKQIRFYQELIWRAPGIDPGTAIITDQEVLPYMGEYAASYAINTIYQPGKFTTPPYWYFPIYYSYPDINSFLQGIPIEYEKFTMTFNGWSTNSLIIAFEPGLDQCLWVLRPEDSDLRLISEDLRRLSQISAVDRIQSTQKGEVELPVDIFGQAKNKGWCYYFEKGDLARQNGEWQKAIMFWENAIAEGEQPGNGFEYLPFIEAYASQGNWEKVKVLVKDAHRISQGLEPSLCRSLENMTAETPASQKRDQTITSLQNYLKCNGDEQ